MSFNPSNLVLAFSGNGRAGAAPPYEYHGREDHPFIWEYNGGADVLANLDGGSGYFTNPFSLPLRVGDLIMATFSDGDALYRIEMMNPGRGTTMTLIKLANVASFGTMTVFVGGQ